MWSGVRINRAGLLRCEPDWNWSPPPRTFVDFDLVYVWGGNGWIDLAENLRLDLSAGTLLCLRPGQPPIRSAHDRLDRLGVCYIHFDFLDRRGEPVRQLAPSSLPALRSETGRGNVRAFTELAVRRVVELFQSQEAAALREAVCYVEGILRGMQRSPGNARSTAASEKEAKSRASSGDARRRLAEVVRHLRENPAESFSVQAMADRAHYSVDHFSRLFMDIHGLTPKEFCINVRLERAQLLLTESNLTVDQIARNLGYADVFFFSRQFKARLGLPPTAWRAATRR